MRPLAPSVNLQGQHTLVLGLPKSYILNQYGWAVEDRGNHCIHLARHKEGMHTVVVGRPSSVANFESLLSHMSRLTQQFIKVPSSSDTVIAQTVQELELSLGE